MKVFKFGGASVKDANSIKNVANIVAKYGLNDSLIIVVSAMGKTTNALEQVWQFLCKGETEHAENKIAEVYRFHEQICKDLFGEIPLSLTPFFRRFKDLPGTALKEDQLYDACVSKGEVLSTRIISDYLSYKGLENEWLDACKLISTSDDFRRAKVNWIFTEENIKNHKFANLSVTQGFIGGGLTGEVTTLGREGSDFSAAIMAYGTQAKSVTIWKDVPGLLNADPKYFSKTELIAQISFREAVELAYYGASVIHPKTIKPLENKEIPLYIKSFVNPEEPGTIIAKDTEYDQDVSSFIFKLHQVLISVSPRDFSFVDESQLTNIFKLLDDKGIKVNLMQNAAISFSFCVDENSRWEEAVQLLQNDFRVLYNKGLELVTVRHPKPETMKQLSTDSGYEVVLEQKTRHTLRMVLNLVNPSLLR